MAPLRIGIIGVGSFGKRHARVCAELAETELVAVCSRTDATVRPVAEEYGVPAFTDYRELVALPDLDAVVVCTPDRAHADPAVVAAQAGKHVFVEKPMAATVQDCDRIMEAARSGVVRLMVGHIVRFDPRYHQARERIASGGLGRLVHMHARRNNPRRAAERAFGVTTPVFWLGSHDIDMLLWCAGSPVRRVYAQANAPLLGERGPDSVLALLTFEDGTVASLEVSWVLPDGTPSSLDALFEAVGTEGRLQIDASTDGLVVYTADGVEHPRSVYAAEVAGRLTGALSEEVRHFARCILDGTEPLVSPAEAREVVRVACAITESYSTGRVVELS